MVDALTNSSIDILKIFTHMYDRAIHTISFQYFTEHQIICQKHRQLHFHFALWEFGDCWNISTLNQILSSFDKRALDLLHSGEIILVVLVSGIGLLHRNQPTQKLKTNYNGDTWKTKNISAFRNMVLRFLLGLYELVKLLSKLIFSLSQKFLLCTQPHFLFLIKENSRCQKTDFHCRIFAQTEMVCS